MRRVLASALAVVALVTPAVALRAAPAAQAQAQPPPGDGLDQTIDAGQAVATGRAVLSKGHVDLGPRFVDGEWTLMVHDDSVEPSVWRRLDETVFQISDKAVLKVPDDPAYSFIGAAGTPVYVVPQVQNPDVAWVGWNTQDPQVMETVDAGVTLTLTGVHGPGDLFVYLQAGNFGDADVLWDSTKREEQDLWVDVNTHTHANWVFTEPGVYLVRAGVSADLVDGRTVTDTAVIRFAIGDAADVDGAFTAQMSAPGPRAAESSAAARAAPGEDGGAGPSPVVFVLGAVALALLVSVVVVVTRGRAAKRRALAGRGTGT
jgi:putative ABC transporter-associated repeat protein